VTASGTDWGPRQPRWTAFWRRRSTGSEPWILFGAATALAAHAHYAQTDDEKTHGRGLFCTCKGHALRILDPANPHLDYPVAGLLLCALGAWGLLHEATPVETAVRLLALADRFAYNRTIPTMMWERIAPRAEKSTPGRLAAVRAEYRDRRPRELLAEAHQVVEQLDC
jgi:hypothetical protein